VPVLAVGEPPGAWGLELEPGGGARWDGVGPGAAGDARFLRSGSSREGRVRVAAIAPEAERRPGEIARLLLRPGPDDAGWVRVTGVTGAELDGPAELPLGGGGSPVADGIAGLGPVPAGGRLEVRYGVSRPGAAVDLRILDVTGRTVRRLAEGPGEPGMRTVVWDGRDQAGSRVAAGIYFVRLRLDGRIWTRKAVLIR
jgi:hypothetical protein